MMNLALIGGEEFSSGFEETHASLLAFARRQRGLGDGQSPKVVFLPTCAAHDGAERIDYWCQTAGERLGELGAQVQALKVVDSRSAHDPEIAAAIRAADMVYLGGGYPQTGMGILAGTPAEQALVDCAREGTLLAGASAGAMILCQHAWVITPELDSAVEQIISGKIDPELVAPPKISFVTGLGLLPGCLCWPHLNMFFSFNWLRGGLLPAETTLLGVEEQTALLLTANGEGRVLGNGRALLVEPEQSGTWYQAGEVVVR